MNYPTIRAALNADIASLTKQIKHLTGLLAQLGEGEAQVPAETPKGRGRPAGANGKAKKTATNGKSDIAAVLKLIGDAKKINAVSLGHVLRKQGLAKIPTAQLVEAGVKVSGTKGSTTYAYAG